MLEKNSDYYLFYRVSKDTHPNANKKEMLQFKSKKRGKPFDIQHVTGLVNMGMSDTASGKHGSNKRGLQYKKAA